MKKILEVAEQYEFTNGKYGFIEGAKWQKEQDKKMYSEEEVKNLFNQYKEKFSLYRNIQILPSVFDEWFEQFKNK